MTKSIFSCSDASDTYSYRSDLEDELMDGACYISTVTYHKQAQDELSVHEGQVVCVVDDSDKSELERELMSVIS